MSKKTPPEVAHTAGPWSWQTDEQQYGDQFTAVYADDATGDHIRCQVLGSNREADAALIARAPEMAEEIERLHAHISENEEKWLEAEAQRDALLAVAKKVAAFAQHWEPLTPGDIEGLRAAIEGCES